VSGRPTVSVVIPTYESGRFVAEAIDSVLAQDEAAHEVVVVDDGSTDDTPQVVEGYGDRIVAVRHEVNRGVAAARNTGLATLTGEVVVMQDADDRMLPHRIRVSLDLLIEAGDGVGCILGRQRIFDERDGDAELPAWARELDGSPVNHASSQVTAWRSTYDRIGGYDESFAVGDDSDWLVRVKEAGLEVCIVEEVLTERRIHDANISERYAARSRPEYLHSVRAMLERRRGAG
jgi:glycosyltransferase involved in cell wall biosynthesis